MSKMKPDSNGFNRLRSAAVGGAVGLMMGGGAAIAATFTINRTRNTEKGGVSSIRYTIATSATTSRNFPSGVGISEASIQAKNVIGMKRVYSTRGINASQINYWHSKLPSSIVDGHQFKTSFTNTGLNSPSYSKSGPYEINEVVHTKHSNITTPTSFPKSCGDATSKIQTLFDFGTNIGWPALYDSKPAIANCYYEVNLRTGSFNLTSKQATATFNHTYGDAFDGVLLAKIDDNSFSNPTSSNLSANTFTAGKTQITTGIDAEIEYYFPPGVGVIRALYTLTNTTAADIDTRVEVAGNMGSDSSTIVELSQSGDSIADDTDKWHITSDISVSDPLVTISRYGDGATSIPTQKAIVGGPDLIHSLDDFSNLYQVNVPANDSVSILVFADINVFLAQAESGAAAFESLPAAEAAGLLEGLTDEQKAAIQNYDIDSDGDGVVDSNDAFPNDPTKSTVPPSSGGGSLNLASLLLLLSGGTTGFVLRRRKMK